MTKARVVLGALLIAATAAGCRTDWASASRDSAGLAPLPAEAREAIVHVYAARAFSWRGTFAVHSWIAVKEADADAYEVIDVTGWRVRRGAGRAVRVREEVPDREWFGATPTLLQELRGEEAAAAIPKLRAAVEAYPYPSSYRMFPGPNSNTFVSHVLRRVPELTVELPPHAIGKDWLEGGGVVDTTESGTGGQLNLLGLLGVQLGLAEGVELNLLGLCFGVDLWSPAVKLPFIGRVGFPDRGL